MGRFSALMLALILGGASVVALASCGGGSDAKLLPGTTASQIESNLDQVKVLAESGDCIGAEDAVAEVSAEVEELNVAAKLKGALQEGTAKLSEVVGRCEEEAAETEEEEAEPSAAADVEAEEELEQKQLEAEEKAEKAQEKAEKQEQKEEEKAEPPAVEEGNQPSGEGKAKGHEEAPPTFEPEPAPEETESGGVSPSEGVE
jgi:flagellar biosynthesis GTPase FlhF